jgi:hypothetical protein
MKATTEEEAEEKTKKEEKEEEVENGERKEDDEQQQQQEQHETDVAQSEQDDKAKPVPWYMVPCVLPTLADDRERLLSGVDSPPTMACLRCATACRVHFFRHPCSLCHSIDICARN